MTFEEYWQREKLDSLRVEELGTASIKELCHRSWAAGKENVSAKT